MENRIDRFGDKLHKLTPEERKKGGRNRKKSLTVRELSKSILGKGCISTEKTRKLCEDLGLEPSTTTIKELMVYRSMIKSASDGDIDTLIKLQGLLGEDAELADIEDMYDIEGKIWGDTDAKE